MATPMRFISIFNYFFCDNNRSGEDSERYDYEYDTSIIDIVENTSRDKSDPF